MNSTSKQEIYEKMLNFKLPSYNEIPNVGLFLEQVTQYVNEYLNPLTGIVITPSMISNYVKKNLIDNPVKKQYYRDQIVYVFFIAICKAVLSLDEIRALVNIKNREYDCKFLYDYFCGELKFSLLKVFGIEKGLEEPKIEMNEDRSLLKDTIWTAAHKIYLDTVFLEFLPAAPASK